MNIIIIIIIIIITIKGTRKKINKSRRGTWMMQTMQE